MAHNFYPDEVTKLLSVLGERIRLARVRRRWTQAEFAERIGVERRTVARMEMGSPGVGMGAFLSALWILELQHTVRDAADPAADAIGLFLERQRMPIQVRHRKEKELDF